jgi:cell division septation protein DedD
MELPYQLIVGCFGSDSNVENMLAQLRNKGIEGYVYDVSNGLKRVSAGGSSSDNELRNRQNELNVKGIKGWIFSGK